MNFQVAIDGPAGSGKSSISKEIAKRLAFTHIDTGAMYRAVTYKALTLNLDLSHDSYSFLDETIIEYRDGSIFLDGCEVDDEIRSVEVSRSVSLVATKKVVRDYMLQIQRQVAETGYIIMDGRDIGTVVLKDASLKVFLNATVEERAKRRYKELDHPTMTLEELCEEIRARDHNDSTRTLNPLKKADDAIELDTTKLTFDEVVQTIVHLIQERGKQYGIQF